MKSQRDILDVSSEPKSGDADTVTIIEHGAGVVEYVGPADLIERFRPALAPRSVRRGSFMTRGPGWLK